jgi:hypothetical protein
MYKYYNPNPIGRRTEDCSVRAVAKALGISWDDAHDLLSYASKQMGTIMNNNDVISAVLRQNGFHRESLPNFCPDCYTIKDFARDNSRGVYVLGTGSHVVTVINGDWFDMWNSGDEVPQYFWTK